MRPWDSSLLGQQFSPEWINDPKIAERRSEDLSPGMPSRLVSLHAADRENSFPENNSSSASQLDALLAAATQVDYENAYSNPQHGPVVNASSQGHTMPVFHRDGGDPMRGVRDPMIAGDD